MAAIAALADRLAVPVQHVHEIYRKELGRLAADARIDAFLDVLALGRTRGILREQTGLANRYRGQIPSLPAAAAMSRAAHSPRR